MNEEAYNKSTLSIVLAVGSIAPSFSDETELPFWLTTSIKKASSGHKTRTVVKCKVNINKEAGTRLQNDKLDTKRHAISVVLFLPYKVHICNALLGHKSTASI